MALDYAVQSDKFSSGLAKVAIASQNDVWGNNDKIGKWCVPDNGWLDLRGYNSLQRIKELTGLK